MQIFLLLGLPGCVCQSLELRENVTKASYVPSASFQRESQNHHLSGFKKTVVHVSNQILYNLLVSFMEEGVVVDWKAQNFAGVHWGYEIPETKIARVNVPCSTLLPKDQCFYTEKECVCCYFLFFQRVNLELLISDNSVWSAFLNGDKPTEWGTPVKVLCSRMRDDKGYTVNSPQHLHFVSIQRSQLK